MKVALLLEIRSEIFGVSLPASRQEGDSTYDLPYTFAYVVDVAVGSSTSGSGFEEYSTIVDTGSANLGIAVRVPIRFHSHICILIFPDCHTLHVGIMVR